MVRSLLFGFAMAIVLSGAAAAQTYICRVTEGYVGIPAGAATVMPREFQVTYEEAGTAIVQHLWFGEAQARRTDVIRVEDAAVMRYRIRRVPELTTRPTLAFSLTHLAAIGRFTISIDAVSRANQYVGSGPCRRA